MKVIDDRQSLISEKKKELSKEITDLVVKLTNAVNARGKQLVYRLNQVCDTKLQILNEKKDALQQLSGHTDHCIEFVTQALEKGSDSAVLFSKKTLASHLQKVKCQRADIPNPEIPVRVQLFLSNVNELLAVIGRVGTILVDGKVFPPAPPPATPAAPPQSRQAKQPSPNITPPLRNNSNPMALPQPPNPNFPPMQQMFTNSGQTSPFPPNITMGRSFSQDGSPNVPGPGRFPMGPPHGLPGQQHVSSSTHPQNMGKSRLSCNSPQSCPKMSVSLPDMNLRGLLNQVAGPAAGNQSMMGGPSGMITCNPQTMIRNMINSQPNPMQNMNQGGNNMMGNGPRFRPNFNQFIPPNMRNMMQNVGDSLLWHLG